MRILQLRAARGWTLEKTARVFLFDLQTLLIWMRRLDEQGERALIQTADPVNRVPFGACGASAQLPCSMLLPGLACSLNYHATLKRWIVGARPL